MTDDQFAVIDRDDDGNPVIRRWLDPREVSVVADPEGSVRAYLWEPEQPPDPGWRVSANEPVRMEET